MVTESAALTTVSEYDGQEEVLIAATQLGAEYSTSAARRVVQEWVTFLSSGPTPIRRLEFTTRTPARLFEALQGQPQLEVLVVKWGDYSALSALQDLTQLRELSLRGASKVTDVSPLSLLTGLRSLVIEGFREIVDPLPLGRLALLESLELGGDWTGPRNGHVPSIRFLRELQTLQQLLLHTLIVGDRDYSPLLDLPALRDVRVMEVRGMTPPFEHLKAALPWNG